MAGDAGFDVLSDDYALRLPNPNQLSNASDILSALRALEAEESSVDQELGEMMADRALLETLLDRIDSVRPVVEQVQLEAGELARRIDETADIAERISGKVRQLDLEQVCSRRMSSTCTKASVLIASNPTHSHSPELLNR